MANYRQMNSYSECADPEALKEAERSAKEESMKHARAGKKMYDEGRQCPINESRRFFNDAITEFTVAIRLYPKCHSFFSSRAQCYLELAEYQSALGDCEKALMLIKPDCTRDIAKSLLRKGKALHGLQRYFDALDTVRKADALLPEQPELLEEIEILQSLAISEVQNSGSASFSQQILAPTIQPKYSSIVEKVTDSVSVQTAPKDPSVDPANPLHAVTIWVGNFQGKKATSQAFLNIFKKYGPIKSYIVSPKKNYGIVTLTDWKKAASAMSEMHNYVFDGVVLKLKFKAEGGDAQKSEARSQSVASNANAKSYSLHDSGVQISRPASVSHSGGEKLNNAIWVGFGKLPDGMVEKDLYDLFICCGTIKSYTLLAKSGCGFVNFCRPEAVGIAINTYDGYTYNGRTMRVEQKIDPSECSEKDDSCSDGEIGSSVGNDEANGSENEVERRRNNHERGTALWIGNLYDPSIKKHHLEELFRPFNPISIYLLTERSHCAFVNFKSRADAEYARSCTNGACLGPRGQEIIVQLKEDRN